MTICPLMTFRPLSHPTGLADVLGPPRDDYPPVECMGDACGWYDRDNDRCSVATIAMAAGPIIDYVEVTK